MKDYNKKNLIFLSEMFASGLAVFCTVVLLTFVKGWLWLAVPLPLAATGYGLYSFLKDFPYKKEDKQ